MKKFARPELLPSDCKYDENIKEQIQSYREYEDDKYLHYFLGFEQIVLLLFEEPAFAFYEDGAFRKVTVNGMLRSIYLSHAEVKDESIKFSQELIDKVRYNIMQATLYQVFLRERGKLSYHKDSLLAAMRGVGIDLSMKSWEEKIYIDLRVDIMKQEEANKPVIMVRIER